MLNSNAQEPSNLEESKGKKADISKQTEAGVNAEKKPKLDESDAQVIKVPLNSNVNTGKNNFYIFLLYLMQ